MIQPKDNSSFLIWHDSSQRTHMMMATILVALSILATIAILKGSLLPNYCGYGTLALGLISFMALVGLILKEPPKTNVQKANFRLVSQEKREEGILYTYQMSLSEFDINDFEKWLLAEAPKNKKELLKATTLARAKQGEFPLTITFSQLAASKDSFEALLKKPLPNSSVIEAHLDWFDFKGTGEIYIDFANAFTFGGGWRDSGNVQEETLFYEFFELALAAYMAYKNGVDIVPANGDPKKTHTLPTPFIFSNCVRHFKVDPALYSKGLNQIKAEEVAAKVTPLKDQVPVTIVGIAAVNWRSVFFNKHYTMDDLKYHLWAAYLAFKANPNKTIHTGLWGCGAFANSDLMITALQILAAKMAKAHIDFTGVNSQIHPNYSKDLIDQIEKWIQTADSPEKILNQLLTFQNHDPANWGPKGSS